MRPRYIAPLNNQYFHTKIKIDKRDMVILKRKIEKIRLKNIKNEYKEHDR